jgi:uroporphyrinogen-III decarboxylase
MAGMTTREIKDNYPGLLMIGGLDNSNMLNEWSMSEIDHAVKEALEGGKNSGGYIISSSEIHPACDPKRVQKMWDSEIKYGWY